VGIATSNLNETHAMRRFHNSWMQYVYSHILTLPQLAELCCTPGSQNASVSYSDGVLLSASYTDYLVRVKRIEAYRLELTIPSFAAKLPIVIATNHVNGTF